MTTNTYIENYDNMTVSDLGTSEAALVPLPQGASIIFETESGKIRAYLELDELCVTTYERGKLIINPSSEDEIYVSVQS